MKDEIREIKSEEMHSLYEPKKTVKYPVNDNCSISTSSYKFCKFPNKCDNLKIIRSQSNSDFNSLFQNKGNPLEFKFEPISTNFLQNRGRWSKEEQIRFIHGIIKFGNDWKKVNEFILSRTNTQIRSHAQKFFLSLRRKLNLDIQTQLNKDSLRKLSKEYVFKYMKRRTNCEMSLKDEEIDRILEVLLHFSFKGKSRINDEVILLMNNSNSNEDRLSNKPNIYDTFLRNKRYFNIEKVHKRNDSYDERTTNFANFRNDMLKSLIVNPYPEEFHSNFTKNILYSEIITIKDDFPHRPHKLSESKKDINLLSVYIDSKNLPKNIQRFVKINDTQILYYLNTRHNSDLNTFILSDDNLSSKIRDKIRNLYKCENNITPIDIFLSKRPSTILNTIKDLNPTKCKLSHNINKDKDKILVPAKMELDKKNIELDIFNWSVMKEETSKKTKDKSFSKEDYSTNSIRNINKDPSEEMNYSNVFRNVSESDNVFANDKILNIMNDNILINVNEKENPFNLNFNINLKDEEIEKEELVSNL